MKTRKLKTAAILGFLIAALTLMLSALSFGAVTYGIANTKHNLGNTGFTTWRAASTSEICIFCHTPHNSVTGKKWLWNRTTDANSPNQNSFALYTSSPTLRFKSGSYGPLSDVSKMCMSCHDGVTALNSMANAKVIDGSAVGSGDAFSTFVYGPFNANPWGPDIGEGAVVDKINYPGTNLTNDHPVSFSYSAAYNGGNSTIKDINVPKSQGLIFWSAAGGTTGDMVECVTCHDPHIKSNPKFLRRSNGSSNLCFACHNK